MTWLAERCLKWRGWRFEGELPAVDKMIIIGAPHTSNWDFIVFLAAIRHWRMSPRFIGKHTLFRPPFGWLFRKLGGIPVDRARPGGLVGQVSAALAEADEMILVMAPEGTRKAAPHWKSGFVEIAARTGAPIVPAVLDFPRRLVRLEAPIRFDGDEVGLMDRLREIYAAGAGKDPTGKGPVRLRNERRRS